MQSFLSEIHCACVTLIFVCWVTSTKCPLDFHRNAKRIICKYDPELYVSRVTVQNDNERALRNHESSAQRYIRSLYQSNIDRINMIIIIIAAPSDAEVWIQWWYFFFLLLFPFNQP